MKLPVLEQEAEKYNYPVVKEILKRDLRGRLNLTNFLSCCQVCGHPEAKRLAGDSPQWHRRSECGASPAAAAHFPQFLREGPQIHHDALYPDHCGAGSKHGDSAVFCASCRGTAAPGVWLPAPPVFQGPHVPVWTGKILTSGYLIGLPAGICYGQSFGVLCPWPLWVNQFWCCYQTLEFQGMINSRGCFLAAGSVGV